MFPDGGTTRSSSTGPPDQPVAVAAASPSSAVDKPADQGRRQPGRQRSRGGSVGVNRSAGTTGTSGSRAWCGRSRLYWATKPSTAACASASEVNGPLSSSSSRRRVRWKRSIFPVVVGDAGWVSRCVMPFSRQILSNNTSPPLPNRSVNCLPLSVRISSGTPNRDNAPANARHTARPVARSTTAAITQNREWSSTPVTILASRTTPVTTSTSQHAADDVDLPQLHRPRPFPPHKRVPRPFPLPLHHQAVPDQDPVDRPDRRHRPLRRWSAQQLHPDPLRTPPRMLPPHLHHRDLDHIGDLRGLDRGRCDRSANPATPPAR